MKTEKVFLCKEGTEEFLIHASNMDEAREAASLYNGVVIGEIKDKELKLNS